MNEADNGRIIPATRHYIHEFEARTSFLTWTIEFAELTATSSVGRISVTTYKDKYDIVTTSSSTNSTEAGLLQFTPPG